MVSFGSWSKGAVYHGRKVADCTAFAVRKQREMDAAAQLLFSLFLWWRIPTSCSNAIPIQIGSSCLGRHHLESHHRSAQRFVPMVILNRVRLEIKVSHQGKKDEK